MLAHTTPQWRKVAMIIGLTMIALEERRMGIPEAYYVERVRLLVDRGELQALGDLTRIRHSEIRRRMP